VEIFIAWLDCVEAGATFCDAPAHVKAFEGYASAGVAAIVRGPATGCFAGRLNRPVEVAETKNSRDLGC
jgi:hypothetical protein